MTIYTETRTDPDVSPRRVGGIVLRRPGRRVRPLARSRYRRPSRVIEPSGSPSPAWPPAFSSIGYTGAVTSSTPSPGVPSMLVSSGVQFPDAFVRDGIVDTSRRELPSGVAQLVCHGVRSET